MLAIASAASYSAYMRFELPSDLNKSLTDIGHTAVGFATLAAKRANDARLDTNVRFKPQVVEARKRALQVVETLQTARLRVESAVEPLVDRAVDRLPENVQDGVGEFRKVRVEFAAKAHDGVVKAIKFATAIPVVPMAKTAKPAATTAAGTATITKAVRSTKSAAKAAAKSVKSPARSAAKTAKSVTVKSVKVKPVAKATRAAKPKVVKATRVAKASRAPKSSRVAKTTTRRRVSAA